MSILALDGGNTTGTALWTPGGLVLGKVVGREMAFSLLQTLPELRCLAYERFVVRGPLKEAHADVLYINGAVEGEAHRRGIPVYSYTSYQTKNARSTVQVTDDMLKECGWWPGFGLRTGGHAADAARVLYLTLKDHYPEEFPCQNQ